MVGSFETQTAERRTWLSVLARTKAELLESLMPTLPDFTFLRAPETGTVMVRGRVGSSGNAFNLGEMTVTRCALRLSDGTIGHGYVQGRSKHHATNAAVIDALMQGREAELIRANVLAPLQNEALNSRKSRAEKAAATKVDFFTLVRGDD